MKIWFAADIAENSRGGIARSMYELSEGLKQRGHKVTVINRGTAAKGNYIVFAFKLFRMFIFSNKDRPDWIIARSSDSVFCALIVRLFRLKTGIILHNHGWEENAYNIERKQAGSIVSNPTTFKGRLIRFPLLRLTLKLCTFCMSGTIYETRYIRERYPKMQSKLVYIPNGVKAQKEVYWRDRIETPYKFLSVGNLTWKKKLEHTVKIFSFIRRQYPDSKLICVGTGVDDSHLHRYIGSDEEMVLNVPSVEQEQMTKWYTTCPFLIASSRYEGGHSLAVLEAMSFGVIVFVSAIEANREIINNGSNGFIITGSDAVYDSEIILNALNSGTDREIRLNAANTAKRNRWDRQVTRLENILCKKM